MKATLFVTWRCTFSSLSFVCAADVVILRQQFGNNSLGLSVDAANRQQICLWTDSGSFTVMQLRIRGRQVPAAGNQTARLEIVHQKTYQAGIAAGQTLACQFTGVAGLLLLILPRELMVFDVDYGQPASSSGLPRSVRPSLERVLCTFRCDNDGKCCIDGGIDGLLCVHEDNSLSSWVREHPGSLAFACIKNENPFKNHLQRTSQSGANGNSLKVNGVAAAIWTDLGGEARQDRGRWSDPERNSAPKVCSEEVARAVLAVVGVSSNGNLWRWESQLPLIVSAACSQEAATPAPSLSAQLKISGLPRTPTSNLASQLPPLRLQGSCPSRVGARFFLAGSVRRLYVPPLSPRFSTTVVYQ